MKNFLATLAFLTIGTLSAFSQSKPTFTTYEFDDQTIIRGMSDNGKWAVSSGSDATNTRLINLDTHAVTIISSTDQTESANDVDDEGKIVVGSKSAKPAYCDIANGNKWINLETKTPYTYGNAYGITADGKLAVGVIYYNDGMLSRPALWNIDTGKLVDTPNLPTKDMSHQDQGMMDFRQISGDGRYILGCMSYSYLPTSEDYGGCFYFVYDRTLQTSHPIGFTETTSGRWTPKTDGLIVVMSAAMSNNGKYVTGSGHLAKEIEGADYYNEYKIPFLYDVENDTFTGYDETAVADTYGSSISNNGTVIDVTPESTPVREWSVKYGQYWFTFSEILKQKYNTDITTETGYDNTGTVSNISNDGKRLVSFPDPYKSYVVDLPVEIDNLGEGVKLLGTYSVSPEEGSEVSHLKNIKVTFDRNISAIGSSTTAQILDANGNTVYNSVGFSAEGKVLSIRFRKGTLDNGQSYKLFIPAGSVVLADDATQANTDIYVTYKGRNDEPVKMTSVYPSEGVAFSFIDYSTSPVLLTFDTDIEITDSASAKLYRNDEAEAYCSLTLARSGNKLALYPSTKQYLYDGSTYRIVVGEGSVTDLAGNNPNEEIEIHYVGNYVRTISADDVILFSDNFDNGYGNFMQWCGDQNVPTEAMTNWDFTQGMAWGLVREDESSADRMACSHSMYTPAGKSDDWLVIPQIYVPDMLCSVKFLSQSYKKNKNDILKVVVWESNNVYNTLTADIIEKMKTEGKVVYEQKQDPGANEESLNGEWTQNNISLADFAEKNVYIAFVNENTDQSAIFMDSLEVRHDMHYLTNLNYEESVVNQEGITISGTLIGNNADKTYNTVTMVLYDADGYAIDAINVDGINLSKNAQWKFSFDNNQLPLTVGIDNKFTVEINVDGEENVIHGSVKDLAFQPTKRIVLEEYTGRACGNCPLGILAMENLEAKYGKQFIPISIHTYNNDPLSSGLSGYTSSLGIDQLGAPSGMINRGTGCYPAVSATVGDATRFFFSNQDPDLPNETDKLWADYADDEMATPADCDIDITDLNYDEATGSITADCQMRYALNSSNLTVNLFTVLLEDNISQAQQNYLSGYSAAELGEWGLGGKYGQSIVTDYLHKDVCRNVNGLTINGTGGYLPSNVTAGNNYDATVSIAVPSNVQSLSQCKVVVMMIDANTGKVINAACSGYLNDTEGIEEVNSEAVKSGESLYTISGQKVSNMNQPGLYIVNGKKILVRK